MVEGITKLKIGLLSCIFLLCGSFALSFYDGELTIFNYAFSLSGVIPFCSIVWWINIIVFVLLCIIFYRLWKYKRLQRNVMSSLAEEAIAKEGILGEKNV